MVAVMAFYTLLPCISQAAPIHYKSVQSAKFICHDAYHGVDSIQPTSTITYFYNGSTLMNAEDNNGDMSTYLDRTVRTIVNVNTQTVLDTQCLFTDGKNVIAQTDSTGTNITSTQQYNAYGQPVNYTSGGDSQIPKSTNQPLSIATNPFQYDGYYYDQESGLYYLNARYYSPTLMQFISMDSYDLANRYGYCDGNPIGNEDPTGHNWEDILGWISNGLGAAGGINSLFSTLSTLLNPEAKIGEILLISLSSLTGFTSSATAFAAQAKNSNTLAIISNTSGLISWLTGLNFAKEAFNGVSTENKFLGIKTGNIKKTAIVIGQIATGTSFGTGEASSFTDGKTSQVLNDVSSITGLVGMASEAVEFKHAYKEIGENYSSNVSKSPGSKLKKAWNYIKTREYKWRDIPENFSIERENNSILNGQDKDQSIINENVKKLYNSFSHNQNEKNSQDLNLSF